MDSTAVLEAVQGWPVEDQLDLAFRLWDHIVASGWQPELTDDLKAELDRRLASSQATPSNVVTWEELVAQVRKQK